MAEIVERLTGRTLDDLAKDVHFRSAADVQHHVSPAEETLAADRADGNR